MNQKMIKKSALVDLTPEQAELFKLFKDLSIANETWDHPPVFTCDESEFMYELLPGGHCKSLLLTDFKGRFILAVALDQTRVDLKTLHKAIDSKRLSFVKPETMQELLQVTPGSVTPFALMHDTNNRIEVLIDSAILPHKTVYFHPLKNDKTTGIAREDLFRFIESTGHSYRIINLSNPLEDES